MTEERLKEIKDSIDLQLSTAKALHFDNNTIEILEEELELYNEVVRLREIIKKLNNEIKKYKYTDNWGDTVVLAKYLEDILKKNNLTLEQTTGIAND